jgi:hypothetical protein
MGAEQSIPYADLYAEFLHSDCEDTMLGNIKQSIVKVDNPQFEVNLKNKLADRNPQFMLILYPKNPMSLDCYCEKIQWNILTPWQWDAILLIRW